MGGSERRAFSEKTGAGDLGSSILMASYEIDVLYIHIKVQCDVSTHTMYYVSIMVTSISITLIFIIFRWGTKILFTG